MPTDPRPVPIEDRVRRSLAVVADRIEPTPDWPAVLALEVPTGDATDGPSSNGGPHPEPAPSRRLLAVGVAAVIITLIASVALIVSARSTDDVRSGPSTTADRPPTTTSTPSRVGEQLTVDAAALPDGVVFLDEEVSRNGIVSAVFGPPGADPAEPAPTGSVIRITAYPVTPGGTTLEDRAAAAYPDATFSEVDGHPAFTAATTGNAGWTTLSWEPRPTLAIAVTTFAIDAEARARVAETVRFQSTSVATEPSTDPAIAARQLSVSFAGTFPDGLAAIDVVHSANDLALRWRAAGLPATAQPEIDFDEETVVFIALGDEGCPSDELRFSGRKGRIQADLVEPATCAQAFGSAMPRTYAYALDRAEIGAPATLTVDPTPTRSGPNASIRVQGG